MELIVCLVVVVILLYYFLFVGRGKKYAIMKNVSVSENKEEYNKLPRSLAMSRKTFSIVMLNKPFAKV